MAKKMRVDVELVEALKAVLAVINSKKLEDIEFYENGKPIKKNVRFMKQFEYINKPNTDYIEMQKLKMGMDRGKKK